MLNKKRPLTKWMDIITEYLQSELTDTAWNEAAKIEIKAKFSNTNK